MARVGLVRYSKANQSGCKNTNVDIIDTHQELQDERNDVVAKGLFLQAKKQINLVQE